LSKGAYILLDVEDGAPDLILLGSGSELQWAVGAKEKLALDGIKARVVSVPSWELFDRQPKEYRDLVLPPSVRKRIAIEAGSPMGWHKYVGDEGEVIAMPGFGASAPANVLFEKFGFNTENVTARAKALLGK
jgi:transketolase